MNGKPNAALAHLRRHADLLLALGVLLALLWLYFRTAAPDVLSGDSAEFQIVGATLGVPHPTTYPLSVLGGWLATQVFPSGTLARRVTLFSVVCVALAMTIGYGVLRRLGLVRAAALLGTLALAFTPGVWGAATVAEAYAPLLLLLCATALALAAGNLRAAALLAGLGATQHGLFVITLLPVVGFWLLHSLFGKTDPARLRIRRTIAVACCFAVGLTPLLYPVLQFARFGPFSGLDYGLPTLFFWGAPRNWGELADLLSGGAVRRGIFRLPDPAAALAVLRMVAARLWFEFGPLGVLLGVVGVWRCGRRPVLLVASGWVAAATLAYLLLLGPAVEDAPVFTLPLLLPWALWLALASDGLLAGPWLRSSAPASRREREGIPGRFGPGTRSRFPRIVAVLLLLAAVGWGYSRLPYTDKRGLTVFRAFGERALAMLPPNAAVISHWEQGTTLLYLHLVERQRPDVVVDINEPGDVPWAARALRYAGRPVCFVGGPASVAGLDVREIVRDGYAALYCAGGARGDGG